MDCEYSSVNASRGSRSADPQSVLFVVICLVFGVEIFGADRCSAGVDHQSDNNSLFFIFLGIDLWSRQLFEELIIKEA